MEEQTRGEERRGEAGAGRANELLLDTRVRKGREREDEDGLEAVEARVRFIGAEGGRDREGAELGHRRRPSVVLSVRRSVRPPPSPFAPPPLSPPNKTDKKLISVEGLGGRKGAGAGRPEPTKHPEGEAR